MTTVALENFYRFFRMQVSTVTVVTARQDKQRTGLTATAVCSVSNSPPSAAAFLSTNSTTIRLVRAAGNFGINILHEDQADVAKIFSKHAATDDEMELKFLQGGQWTVGYIGVPVLQDGLATLVCNVIQIAEVHTHAVVFGLAQNVIFHRSGRPLLYGFKRFCSVAPPPAEPEFTI